MKNETKHRNNCSGKDAETLPPNRGLSGGAEPTVSLREWGQLRNTQCFGILRKGGKSGQEAKISAVLQEAWGKDNPSPAGPVTLL